MTITALEQRSNTWPYLPASLRIAKLVPAAVLVSAVGVASTSPPLVRAATAVPAVALLVAMCLKSYRRAIVILLIWLAVLGTVRRLLLPSGGVARSDPLLLVAPVVVGLLVVVAARQGAFSHQTRLTKSVLLLSGLVVVSALNPLQGGIAVGAGGLLFVIVPLLWFWVGRALVDDALLTKVLRLISVLALGGAVYGLFQVYRGFPEWDQRWIDTKGYVALYVGESVRPFGSFASSSEYVGILSIGTVIWAVHLRRAPRVLPAAAALTVLGWALTVASVRGALVVVPIALGVIFGASRGFDMGRTAIMGIGALFVLAVVVSQFDPSGVGGERTSALVSRQVRGLADPLNADVSTLPLHIDQVVSGVGRGLRNPIGQGIGTVTIAAERFGGETVGTDSDPSNIGVATGIPGLVAYCVVVAIGFRLAFRTARDRRDFLSLVALGILVVTLFQWLNGGSYAVAPFPWLMLGWLDRRSRTAPTAITPFPSTPSRALPLKEPGHQLT